MTRAFFRDDRGTTAIEYALIAGIISLAIITGTAMWSDQVIALFNLISETVSS